MWSSYHGLIIHSAQCTNGAVYLTGGSSSRGTVQLCYNRQWGTVCDDLWSSSDADVVCRQLGYSRESYAE